ncbi:interferon-induced protein with tetratricopeptide repeats 1-like [Trichosurus vulpecula]|uniref:interferon-induced protein with tetratricopeptide repeats 1-like n=1 Tax=Trichosurus vulpecula TaxID=9337 RepID=UPI00186AC863|nr:interferon-induced protein with tetratricopeptide repeats 1-like [Trichosurus vulpecula]
MEIWILLFWLYRSALHCLREAKPASEEELRLFHNPSEPHRRNQGAIMSEISEKNPMMDALLELRCHFTWNLMRMDIDLPDLENRILDEIEFLDTKFNVGIRNILAYVKHVRGQNEKALESLREAEKFIQQLNDDQAEIKVLVTWGNYAWIYYHMDRLPEAQTYLEKVEASCKKFSSPFRYKVEHPEIDCEKGWALLKFVKEYYEEAKDCFQKALESEPENPEFNTGFAIAMFRLDRFVRDQPSISLEPLKRAITFNPEDAYLKVLLALKLQAFGQEEEGEKYITEALKNMSSQPYVFRYAAKFYCKKGCIDKALDFLNIALQATPTSAVVYHQIGYCYKTKVLQIKKATNYRPQGKDRYDLEEAVRSAISHFKTSVEYRPTFEASHIELGNMYAEAGDFRKAEESFQKVLSMNQLPDNIKQEVYYNYGRYQEIHRKSEADALACYLEGLKVNPEKKYLLNALEKLATRRLRRNASDVESLSLIGFIHKMKGEPGEAIQCYEKALESGSSLLLSRTSLFPPDAAQGLASS